MRRSELLAEVSTWLGKRRLVWIGTRGDDAEAITDLPQFDAAFSIISALDSRTSIESLSLESLNLRRPDLDTYDIDDDPTSEALGEFRAAILRSLSRPSVMFTYRPTVFTSGIAFSRQKRCGYLGLFKGHQAAFEHKPWLESSIEELAIPHIPWTYVADIDQFETLRLMRDGPVMLRPSRTTGGVGLVRLDDPDRLHDLWPAEPEAYVSVAPFIADATPVNVGAVAWNDGVTVHPASIQLIGIEGCTTRRFGYCGNDFGAVRTLDSSTLDQIQASTTAVGNWLRRYGYRGAFGVDFLVKDGIPLFTEVNPRFQGSTHASCQLSVENSESCLLLEHLAAFIGIEAPPTRQLTEHARAAGDFAHVVVHNTGGDVTVEPDGLLEPLRRLPTFARSDVTTSQRWVTETGGTLARITLRDRVTDSGFELLDPYRQVVEQASLARSV